MSTQKSATWAGTSASSVSRWKGIRKGVRPVTPHQSVEIFSGFMRLRSHGYRLHGCRSRVLPSHRRQQRQRALPARRRLWLGPRSSVRSEPLPPYYESRACWVCVCVCAAAVNISKRPTLQRTNYVQRNMNVSVGTRLRPVRCTTVQNNPLIH